MIRYNKTLEINRPLIFLCGPGYPQKPSEEVLAKEKETRSQADYFEYEKNEFINFKKKLYSDRRYILKNYISNNFKRTTSHKYHATPIIVDTIFNNHEYINNNNLSYSFLEEIISAIAYKTYIFLDTMSTSYELGLFTNSKVNNNVYLFVDSDRDSKRIPPIGDYIKFANNNSILSYPADYKVNDDNTKDYTYFVDNKIPTEISDFLSEDLKDLSNHTNPININFTNLLPNNLEFGQFYFESKNDCVEFLTDIKTLFYYVESIIRNYRIKLYDFKKIKDYLLKDVLNCFLFEYACHLDNLNLFITRKANISCDGYKDFDNILKHIICCIELIKKSNPNNSNQNIVLCEKGTNKPTKANILFNTNEFIYKLFNISHEDIKLSEDYSKNQSRYVKEFFIKTNNKKRKIITYKNNSRGKKLRALHEKINNTFNTFFKQSSVSFGYKVESNTKKCIEQHTISKCFYKVDIHKFFESINRSKLSMSICKKIDLLFEDYLSVYGNYKSQFKKFLKVVYYKNYLPIGFICSPKLSDMFLYDFDEHIKNKFKHLFVTRYADDLLISSKTNSKEFKSSFAEISIELSKLKLSINTRKSFQRIFKKDGDSIKFVGINLVYNVKNKKNRITISKKYLINTSKLLFEFVNTKNDLLFDKVLGMCNYIKYISPESFNKLVSIYEKKTNLEFPFIEHKVTT